MWVPGDLVVGDLLLYDSDLYDGTVELMGGEIEGLRKFHRLCVWIHNQLPWQRDREGQETPLSLTHSFTLLVPLLELRIEASAWYIRGQLGKHCMAGLYSNPQLSSQPHFRDRVSLATKMVMELPV